MDDQRDAQRSLEQYRLLTARETGLEFGRGSYAAVVEVDYKGLRCAGKKIHRVLYEGEVDNLVRRFEEECRLLSQLRHLTLSSSLASTLRWTPMPQFW